MRFRAWTRGELANSTCSSEESVLSEDLCEVTIKSDSDGEEWVLFPAGKSLVMNIISAVIYYKMYYYNIVM